MIALGLASLVLAALWTSFPDVSRPRECEGAATEPFPWFAVEAPTEPKAESLPRLIRRKPIAPRKPDAPDPTTSIEVRGGMGLDRAELRIASQTIATNDAREVLITAGRKRLEWRRSGRDSWKPGGMWTFEPGTKVVVFVTERGLAIRPIR